MRFPGAAGGGGRGSSAKISYLPQPTFSAEGSLGEVKTFPGPRGDRVAAAPAVFKSKRCRCFRKQVYRRCKL